MTDRAATFENPNFEDPPASFNQRSDTVRLVLDDLTSFGFVRTRPVQKSLDYLSNLEPKWKFALGVSIGILVIFLLLSSLSPECHSPNSSSEEITPPSIHSTMKDTPLETEARETITTGPKAVFKFFSPKVTWWQAKLRSREEGGDLASVLDEKENRMLLKVLQEGLGLFADGVWIGGITRNGNNRFEWIDGSPWRYDNWVPGHPSYTDSRRCVRITINKNENDWYTERCDETFPFICKMYT
ncbi:hypothetical protein QR680_011482 [Steinernema hermaphroditum]|uniref:C-type lectin domain-containing protein n=1 Tax=Steinernema hermaphroditum TaxID=289476 RepID=A0AA39HYQ4_9BILA|nr:hypothetical protein QR680_011482 [Steinernema hermaphroditum]